ncbi:DUF5372 family protein [Catenulispora subtropica]|uniref:DUF5372 family protein n=1 Tax=Catenulispora subtropica TaxID=450798 RepID=UPI0031CE0AA4
MTHPFHPLAGCRLAVAFTERKAGSLVFVCGDGDAEWVRIPLSWTDKVPLLAGHRLSAEGLTALKALVDALSKAPGHRCASLRGGEKLQVEGSSPNADSPEVRHGVGAGSDGAGDGAGEHGAGGAEGRRR